MTEVACVCTGAALRDAMLVVIVKTRCELDESRVDCLCSTTSRRPTNSRVTTPPTIALAVDLDTKLLVQIKVEALHFGGLHVPTI